MNRRRLLLEEMDIAPLWRVRGAQPDAQIAEPALPMPPVEAKPDTPARPPAAPVPPIQTTSPARTRTINTPVARKAEPLRDARAQEILRMDWSTLQASVAQCVACPLHERRTNAVFGVGDAQAQWLFVGEGPGADEDVKGEPFVGQAGRLLDNMLAAIDLARGDNVYIANVVKCRPPGNRNPETGEMSCCEPYLSRQIELIQPKLIVALGKTAAGHLLQTDASIASLRGRLHAFRGIPLIVTYHPAYLLRTLQEKSRSWADLCFARETMATLSQQAAAG